MMKLFQLVLFLMVSLPVSAQTIVARSGEHESFSRIVLPFENPTSWEMGRFDGGYIIRFETPIDEIDVENVYRLIPKTRISNLEFSMQDNALKLFVICECHANAFDFKEGKVVLDVLDGQAATGSQFETFLKSPNGEEKNDTFTSSVQPIIRLLDSETSLQEEQGDNVGASNLEKAKSHALALASKPLTISKRPVSLLLDTFPGLEERPADVGIAEVLNSKVEDMEAKLAIQIGRASSQGLLEPNIPREHTFPSAPEPIVAESEPQIIASRTRETTHVRFQATTSIDLGLQDSLAMSGAVGNSGTQNECLPEKIFSVEDWGNERSILSAVSKARIRLSSEFDATSYEAAESLVMAYIYASFGSEAIQVLDTQGTQLLNYDILSELAWTIEYGEGAKKEILSEQLNCSTAGALWAILAISEIPKNHSIDLPLVKKSFSKLPLHLRRYLGPRLVDTFLRAGDRKSAVEIRNAVSRATGQHGAEFTFMDAKLENTQGHSLGTNETLLTIAVGGSETSVNVLLEIVRNEIEAEQLVSKSKILSLEAFAFELRGTATEAKIVSTLVAAMVNNKNFQMAWDALTASLDKSVLPPEVSLSLYSEILTGAEEIMDDAPFIEFIYNNEELIVSLDLAHSLKLRLAKRLVENGFSSVPLAILGTQQPIEEIDALIFAGASINNNQPEKAIELTANYPNNVAATRIRVVAASLLKDKGLVAFEKAKLGDDEVTTEAQWRNRDFTSISKNSGSDLSSFVSLLEPLRKGSWKNGEGELELPLLREKIGKTRNFRRVASKLLEKFEKPF